MMGANRDPRIRGDQPCQDKPCQKRTLDHITVFHSNDYEPQERWRDIAKASETKNNRFSCLKSKQSRHQPHYIGFHTTTTEAAVSIAHSDFQPSKTGWLGAGAYFARSVNGTINKARGGKGVWFIAEIRMGKVQ
jgi:hypothetical protein